MGNDTQRKEDTFVFYPSFIEQITAIQNDKAQLALSLAVMNYGVYGILPNFSEIDPMGALEAAFIPMRRSIDKQRGRSATNSANGSKGGAPIGNNNARKKTSELQTETSENKQIQAKTSETSLKDKSKDKSKDKESKKRTARAVFSAPTLEEVKDYFVEQDFSSSPDEYFDYYTSNGWKVGKNAMKDWKAAARNWEKRQTEFASKTTNHSQSKAKTKSKTPDYSDDDFGGVDYDSPTRKMNYSGGFGGVKY